MLSLAANVCVFLRTQPVDMRKSFDGLSVLVMDVLEDNPLSGALFAFCNRRGDKLKVLYYDGQGLCLWYKCLERGRFRIPATQRDAVQLSAKELGLLLDGLEVGLAARMPRRAIQSVA
jgi:transposase